MYIHAMYYVYTVDLYESIHVFQFPFPFHAGILV